MLIQVLIFIIALAGLLLSARIFTSGAEKIGHFFKLPPFIIGVFIIGIGTSLPELVSALFAVQSGASEIITGNILGSNIANILLILGLVASFSKFGISLSSRYIMIDLHYHLGTALLFLLVAYDGSISMYEGMALMAAFLIHALYMLRSQQNDNHSKAADKPEKFPVKEALFMAVSALGIYFAGQYTVGSLQEIALGLNIAPSIISLTLLSFGTTLPELVVSFILVRKNQAEEAVGNVLGSCVFNATMIPGLASLFGTIIVPIDLMQLPMYVFMGATLFFYLLTQDKRISSWEGMLFVLFYLVFILKTANVI